ncbi:ATP-binding cassette domain-containing protein [Agrococcus baldri]|uniref:Daunorubicin resistance protein DrrA family ABC transporter ATP-binding protein n=1 Tax=Agrococcus baldri TaxID=153730 RepID=A0AA87RGM7_9MICO|nr:ATP-binding cassette domain-containing protein [Agrococcus baldri]GEK80096.1 daunorubicin resistance protein DrrA family ABC transporter ATP-binding protein [Agrococcus baldri]
MSPTIEVTGLGKSYGSEPVLASLDLVVDGGVLALLGPNGAGKTTLVSILTTLVKPDSGSARVLGHDVVRDAAAVRRLVRVTGQASSLDELLTGRENLVLLGRLLGLGRRAKPRADELLERLDLTAAGGRSVRGYSGGMRRRIDLAASLIAPAGVLFLDEPTTGLDPTSRARVWEDVRELAAAGTTVLLTTQTLDEAEALADRITVLDHGRIVADGTADELTALVGGQTVVLLDAAGTVIGQSETDGTPASVARALTALDPGNVEGARIELRSPTLDDAFAAITTRPREEVAA